MLKLSYSEKIKTSPLTALFKNYYICLISRCITYGLPAITISQGSGVLAVYANKRGWFKELFAQAAVCSGACLPLTPHSRSLCAGYLATYFQGFVHLQEYESSEDQLIPAPCTSAGNHHGISIHPFSSLFKFRFIPHDCEVSFHT